MEVLSYKIEDFEGPLDLLLQLIARNKMNIHDIHLTALIDQYLEQIRQFEGLNLEIASEFLEMAARLIYMKTLSLLPKHEEIVQFKEELTGELLEYKICQEVARTFSTMTVGFDRFVRKTDDIDFDRTYELTHPSDTIYLSYLAAVGRGQRKLPPPATSFTKIVATKIVAVSTRIVFVMRKLWGGGSKQLHTLYQSARSRSELVATFLAVLELCKAERVRIDGEAQDAQIKLVKGHKRR